jgi:hypothetical protein
LLDLGDGEGDRSYLNEDRLRELIDAMENDEDKKVLGNALVWLGISDKVDESVFKLIWA